MILNPYLALDGSARAAMTFYAEVFGGQPDLLTQAQVGMPDDGTDSIMHGYLHTDAGFDLMGSDFGPAEATMQGVAISGAPEDEPTLRHYWDALKDGAREVHMELGPAPWGGTFGGVTDKFGITWNISIMGG